MLKYKAQLPESQEDCIKHAVELGIDVGWALLQRRRYMMQQGFSGDKLYKYQPEDIAQCREIPYYKVLDLPKDNIMIQCPFHKDKHPSFLVRGNFGYCFGCGVKEDTISAVKRIYNYTFSQAIQWLLVKVREGWEV